MNGKMLFFFPETTEFHLIPNTQTLLYALEFAFQASKSEDLFRTCSSPVGVVTIQAWHL